MGVHGAQPSILILLRPVGREREKGKGHGEIQLGKAKYMYLR